MLSIRTVPGISAGHATDASQAHDALALAISPVHTVLGGGHGLCPVDLPHAGTGRAGGLVSLGAVAAETLRTAIERSVTVG